MKISGILTIFLSFIAVTTAWSQARMVFQNDPYVVINDQAYVVLDNPNANAITNPAQGNIVSEDEFNYVKWNIGGSTGSYVVPFTTANDFKVPVTVNITGAGAGGADPSILFSTYGGLGVGPWDSFTNRPTPVAHTVDIATGSINNSPFVIDRYYIMDAGGYVTKPSATLSIGYADEEHSAVAGNTIVEGQLGAQRYNSDTNEWGDYLPQGTINTAANVVTAIPAPNADFYRAWTLSSLQSPLPIELLSFDATCDNGVVQIAWATASEQNNDYFLIERSLDGLAWEAFREVAGNGNSNNKIEYSVTDYAPLGNTTYYRLTQFDYNGDYRVYPPEVGGCGDFNLEIVSVLGNYNSDALLLNVSSSVNEQFELLVTDMSGKVLIAKQGIAIAEGMNQINISKRDMSMGIYLIKLVNDNHVLTRRVAIN